MFTRRSLLLVLPLAATATVLFLRPHAGTAKASPESAQGSSSGITTIALGPHVLRTGVERFGINLSGQSFYDSGQMMRNLVARNPGFEGEIWQSILRCKVTTPSSCTEENQYTVWPAGFLDGANFEVLSGAGQGQQGTVVSSTAATAPNGVTLHFAPLARPLLKGDFVAVRMRRPGDPTAGWSTDPHGGATFAAEQKDLAPNTPGKQALRIEASGPGQSATLSSYFDSLEGHSFVQLHGPYEFHFRARAAGGSGQMGIMLSRLDMAHGREEFFRRDLQLTQGWHDYSFAFQAHEDGRAVGTVALQFTLTGASALLDDVSLVSKTPSAAPAFRAEVVQALRALQPGLLRYMDSGAAFGSTLDNLLLPEFARQRAGYSTQELGRDDIAIGLEDFLELCAAVGADPWISLPAAFSPVEAGNLIDFLTGPGSSAYGARRMAFGHPAPWMQTFHTIHLELGNEQWNSRSFAGATIHDPIAYAHRADVVFGAMRRAPGFAADRFDLIAGTWNAVPWWTGQELAAAETVDTVAIAPYLFAEFNDAASDEAIYGPMLAQPEQLNSRKDVDGDFVAQQTAEIAKARRPVRLAAYEVNLGSMSGSATQAQLDRIVPSWGGGLAVADHMLLMLRDQGITTQALFCLPEFRNVFMNTGGGGQETMPLWGAVVDMGGATDRKRPTYLALQAINRALLPNMLQTMLSGADPTWDQPLSRNDKIALRGAHELQTFAFADDKGQRSAILLNLSRTKTHAVQLTAPDLPAGAVEEITLAPQKLSEGNELAETVRPVEATLPPARLASPFNLPPGSLTVLRWSVSPASTR